MHKVFNSAVHWVSGFSWKKCPESDSNYITVNILIARQRKEWDFICIISTYPSFSHAAVSCWWLQVVASLPVPAVVSKSFWNPGDIMCKMFPVSSSSTPGKSWKTFKVETPSRIHPNQMPEAPQPAPFHSEPRRADSDSLSPLPRSDHMTFKVVSSHTTYSRIRRLSVSTTLLTDDMHSPDLVFENAT